MYKLLNKLYRFLKQKILELNTEIEGIIDENKELIKNQKEFEKNLNNFEKEKNDKSSRFLFFANEISIYLQKTNTFQVIKIFFQYLLNESEYGKRKNQKKYEEFNQSAKEIWY